MKKIIFVVILIIGFIFFDSFISKQKINNKFAAKQEAASNIEADYDKIDKLTKAMNKIKDTSAIKAYSDPAGRYQFDIRAIYQDGANDFHKALRKELGEDFNSQLSNGELLFAEIYPLKKSVKIYVGAPTQTNENMVYPDWKYTGLKKK